MELLRRAATDHQKKHHQTFAVLSIFASVLVWLVVSTSTFCYFFPLYRDSVINLDHFSDLEDFIGTRNVAMLLITQRDDDASEVLEFQFQEAGVELARVHGSSMLARGDVRSDFQFGRLFPVEEAGGPAVFVYQGGTWKLETRVSTQSRAEDIVKTFASRVQEWRSAPGRHNAEVAEPGSRGSSLTRLHSDLLRNLQHNTAQSFLCLLFGLSITAPMVNLVLFKGIGLSKAANPADSCMLIELGRLDV